MKNEEKSSTQRDVMLHKHQDYTEEYTTQRLGTRSQTPGKNKVLFKHLPLQFSPSSIFNILINLNSVLMSRFVFL